MVNEYDRDTYLDYNPYYRQNAQKHIHDKVKIDRSLFHTKRIKCKKSRKKL